MITNDLNRAEFTSDGSSTAYVFQNSDASIQVKVKDKSHIKVNVITTGNFTATDGSSVFDHEDHGHANGEIVTLTAGTSLPIGLKSGTDYYIREKTDDTFKLEASVDGGAISVSGTGSGTLTWTKTTLKTLDTDYSVAINKDNTATVTWLSGKIPINTVKFFFLREVPYTQEVDLLNNSLIEAESLENQLDLIVNQTQQLKAKTDRNLKFDDNLLINDATEAQASLNVTATDRQNKSLKFDAQGALSVTSVNVDDAEDYVLEAKSYATEDGAVVNHFSSGVADPQTGVYSAREHAVGSATPSAKDYATKVTGGAVTGSEFSAKEYAQGSQASTGGSAKNWATQTDADVTGASTHDMSAKEWAVGVRGRTNAGEGSAKDWATLAVSDGKVDNQYYSSKAYAQSATIGTNTYGGSAKGWASTAYNTDVPGAGSGSRSALHYWTDAANSATAAKNSANAVANTFDAFDDVYLGKMSDTVTFTGSSDSGLLITSNAHGLVATQIIRVENSGGALPGNLSASTDYYVRDVTTNTFRLATSSNGTAIAHSSNGTGTNSWYYADFTTPTSSSWSKNSSTITVASNVGIRVGQVVSGTGIPSPSDSPPNPKPNVLSISGTSIVISENMTAAGSSVAVTFANKGVYGAFNTTKDGPSTDNDGDALADGMLYFNTTDNNMMVYKTTGAAWIPATSSGGVSLVMHKAVASGTPTSLAASDFTPTLSYEVNNIVVFLNGVRLDATDYTATTGTTITGLAALANGDEMTILAFKTFEVGDAVSAASGGTFNANVSFGDNNITNVGDIALDTITADGSSIVINDDTSFGDNNITNVGSIALDSIVADGTSITISSDTALSAGKDLETSTTGKIKQKGSAFQSHITASLALGY